jgi:hypothetical protein
MMINFSFRKEQRKKREQKLGQKEVILDQVRKVLAETDQSLILMAK